MKRMNRYFKMVEIEEKEFESETMEQLEDNELIISVNGDVYVAIDEEQEDEISIPLDCF